MKARLCHQTIVIKDWPITLHQNSVDNFTVIYGKQVKRGLTYSEAAREYGACIMHALSCEGLLDNGR